MERIRNYFLKHGILHKAQYPSGLKAGYAGHLNPLRKTYWQGYAQTFWNTHPIYTVYIKILTLITLPLTKVLPGYGKKQ